MASATTALVLGTMTFAPPAMAAVSTDAQVVINEVYGGGGNSGAPFKNDFIELYNKGATAVDLSGYSIQYKSADGASWSGLTKLTGSIAPGAYYLVAESSGGAAGEDLPPADGSTGSFNLSATNGVIALATSQGRLTCLKEACATDPAVADLVGFGTGDTFLNKAAPAGSNTQSIGRDAAAANTANNAADFTAMTPSPKAVNTTTAPPVDEGSKTIAEIQGTGATSPFAGDIVTTKGVVTATYPTGGFNGYVIQTPGTGGDIDLAKHTASDGLFVYSSATVGTVAVGDYLKITGKVSEFSGLTELTPTDAASVVKLSDAHDAVTPATLAWPATDAQRESLESMLIAPQGDYTITNTYSTNQYGEVGLAAGDKPLIQWTEVAKPGTSEADAVKADNAARAVTLDDGASINFLSAGNSDLTPSYVSNDNPVRVGAAVSFTKPVIVDYRNNAWKFQPTAPIPDKGTDFPATWTNTRTPAPDAAKIGDGEIKVASFNVLNFFTMTGEKYQSATGVTCTPYSDRDGNPITVSKCSDGQGPRGAWDDANFERQYAKTVAAISASGANVIGLMEIENSRVLGEPVDTTVKFLVDQLNAKAGSDVWAFVPSPTADLPTDNANMDVINNAIIYQKAAVQRVGDSHALGTQSAPGQAFGNAREPIAQVFEPVGGGEPFLFVVNHFKSKGSAGSYPGDKDTGDGQGASNESRIHQAEALRDWIPTVQGDTKAVIMVGDYNSYSQEDPLQVLYTEGYTDAERDFNVGKYSYSFSGLSGSLDHVLLNQAAKDRATGADIWNINSPESIALEYSRYNYSGTDFYRPDAYASSDHDPVVVGIKKGNAAPVTKQVQVLGINDFHGRIQASGQEAGAAVLAGAVGKLREQYPNTVFSAAGDLIGASTFESFIAHDKPTIDALNAAGLEVSAVGNHEFDQGYDDLINRVMAPYDKETNPYGGAEWKYLGANVKIKGSNNPAIDATWVKEMNGVKVGFVGAVTEHLDELVSPAGIAGLEITDIASAVNTEADNLKAEGVNIVVMLVHEGSPDSSCPSVTDPSNDFGKIVTKLDGNVDAVISGHTHLTYNCMVNVPQWQQEGRAVTQRPVVSAGQYGYNLDQLIFTVDGSGTVTGVESNTLALTEKNDAGTWVPNPDYPADPTVSKIVADAVAQADVLGKQPLGQIGGAFNRAKLANGSTENRGGESTLGNLVAEAQRWATETPTAGSAQIAFMNPGGLRADMAGDNADGYPAVLTYKQAATVQPFANTLVNMSLTGAQIKTVLEQQWQPAGSSRPFLRLGISAGFTYTYDPAAEAGSHITAMWLNGAAIDPAKTYSVTVNSFLASGGDNFFELANGANKKDTGQTDLQGMVDYMAAKAKDAPLPVDYSQRSVGVSFPAGAPASYKAGDTVAFALSSLAMSTPVNTAVAGSFDTSVTVKLGTQVLGTFAVDNTTADVSTDEVGTTSVSFALPSGIAAGTQQLTITGDRTGTSTSVAITTEAAPVALPVRVKLDASSNIEIQGIGKGITLTATTSTKQGAVTSGTVTFTDNGKKLATAPVNAKGKAQTTFPAKASVGLHLLWATHTDKLGTTSAPSNLELIVVLPNLFGWLR